MAAKRVVGCLAVALMGLVVVVGYRSLVVSAQEAGPCARLPPPILGDVPRTPGDNGYRIAIAGDPDKYIPGETYIVTLKGWRTHLSVQKFIGFTLTVDSLEPGRAGSFLLYDDFLSQFTPGCSNFVSQTTFHYKAEIQVRWTAPYIGSGCVNFRALLVENKETWYMDDGSLTKEFCEEETENLDEQPQVLQECCACDEAKYQLEFEGLWSNATHPKDFPTNEWLLHFSDIIGASHNPHYTMWEYGGYASEGLQYVAEWGSTRNMETELKAQAEHIRTIIKARGLWFPNVNGKANAVFRVDKRHHLMSLVSMLGPSPDWVVGVDKLELCLVNCSWVEQRVLNLYPWDAGTDSGVTYSSPNIPTYPREPITKISPTFPANEKAPFYDPLGVPMNPVAKLTVSRQRLYAKSCTDDELIADPVGDPGSDASDDSRAECATGDWTDFTPCSVTCGKGLRSRSRVYLMPMKADMMGCNVILVQREMCAAAEPVCDDDEADGSSEEVLTGMAAKRCAVTPWSDWTSCSVTCGKGTRTRTRSYLDPMAQKMCTLATRDTEMCMAASTCDEEEEIDPQCAVTAWSDWSPCTVTCGKGTKFRVRQYLDPGAQTKCTVETTQKLMCVADKMDCSVDQEEAREICMLEKSVGPCRGYFPRWYFDSSKRMCLQFIYGGCRGNRNNFERYEDCNQMCHMLRADSKPSLPAVRSVAQPVRSESSQPTEVSKPMRAPQQPAPLPSLPAVPPPAIHPTATPVHCMVTDWTDWSPCSATCGKGRMERRRMIKIQARNGGRACPKKLVQRKRCPTLPPCYHPRNQSNAVQNQQA